MASEPPNNPNATAFAASLAKTLAVLSAIATLSCFCVGLVRLGFGQFDFLTGLAFATAFLFFIGLAQLALYLSAAPARQNLADETASVVAQAAEAIAEKAGSSPAAASKTGANVRRVTGVVTKWALFFASQSGVGALLSAFSGGLIGVLTVLVTYKQVELLGSQTTIMEKQTSLMTAENNARTLEYHLTSLVSDIRRLNPVSENTDPLWDTLKERANILSRALVPVDSRDDVKAVFSRDRGILLATLVAESFPLGKVRSPELHLGHADLSFLPLVSDERHLSLGKVDLSGAYARETSFRNYDLSGANLRGSYLPLATSFERAMLRNRRPPHTTTHTFLDEYRGYASADLNGAHVPSENWLHEVEGLLGPHAFTALPYSVYEIEPGDFVVKADVDSTSLSGEQMLVDLLIDAKNSCSPNLVARTCGATLFCKHYGSIISSAKSARKRGSLLRIALQVSREIRNQDFPGPQLSVATQDELAATMGKCIAQLTFDGKLAVDASHLNLQLDYLNGADLGQVDWEQASIVATFRDVRLPLAKDYLKASGVNANYHNERFDRWVGAEVPAGNWEYEVCMGKFTSTDLNGSPVEFFPFGEIEVKHEKSGFFLRQSNRAKCSFEHSADYDSRQEYCSQCSAIAN